MSTKKITKKLFYGDNLELLRNHVKDNSITLCYIDPPFNSNKKYNQIYNDKKKDVKEQVQAFTDTWKWEDRAIVGYNEVVSNYKNLFELKTIKLIEGLKNVLGETSLLAYLVSMTQRINEIQRILKPNGSFYLHCDPTASHYLKLVCDSIFCTRGGDFLNEIIWCYRKWTNNTSQFQSNHDVILFYSKSDEHTFNKLFDETVIGKHYEKGYHTNTIKTGESQLIVYDKKKAKALIDSSKYDKIIYREGETEVILPDWWQISILNSQAKERLGYPTQKPESLLEKIILASTNKNDIVLDCYCGCGTTIAVAERLNRGWIGMDITYQSIALIKKRLEDTFGKDFVKKDIEEEGDPKNKEQVLQLINLKDDRLRKEFEKWAILKYTESRGFINEKKGKDQGIDGVARIIHDRENNFKDVIFSVKSGSNVGSAMVRNLRGVIERENAAIGILISYHHPTKDMLAEAKSAGFYHSQLFDKDFPKLQIITVDDILNGQTLSFPMVTDIAKKAEKKINEKLNKGKQTLFDFNK